MRTTIDDAGRIVVPKALREALGFSAGQILELQVADGRLEIEVAATPMRLEGRGSGLVATPERALPPLSADEVRIALEQTRR